MIKNDYLDQQGIVAIEGRNTTLKCICEKKECKEENASTYWKFNGSNVNAPQKFKLSKEVLPYGAKMEMTILDVSPTDQGIFYCGINTSKGFQRFQGDYMSFPVVRFLWLCMLWSYWCDHFTLGYRSYWCDHFTLGYRSYWCDHFTSTSRRRNKRHIWVLASKCLMGFYEVNQGSWHMGSLWEGGKQRGS